MKAEEFRIGNLVDRTDYICKVISIDSEGIMTDPIEMKEERFVQQELKPIPLTEEWLVRFGFKDDFLWYQTERGTEKDQMKMIGVYGVRITPHQITMSKSVGHDTVLIHNNLKYVHQLQNLYFALTGEELTIK